jgi:DUF971 family protein
VNHRTEKPIQPVGIRLCSTAGVLEIDWADSGTSSLRHSLLRRQCQCAECRAGRRDGHVVGEQVDIVILDVVPYGQNALRLTFSDGHARGIYPFDYLRQLAEQDSKGAIETASAPARC